MAMKMYGEYVLPIDQTAVWNALNDPQVLAASVPGCDEFSEVDAGRYRVAAQVKVGPVKARFRGEVALSEIDAPNGYRISGQGEGGIAGFAKGAATVRLEPTGDGGTLLVYDVDAQIGGKIAQIGQRLINGAAKKTADEFFENFRREISLRQADMPLFAS
jgi:carbon monoxide dehydrogenase subunit G